MIHDVRVALAAEGAGEGATVARRARGVFRPVASLLLTPGADALLMLMC